MTEFVIATTAVFIGRPAEEFQLHSRRHPISQVSQRGEPGQAISLTNKRRSARQCIEMDATIVISKRTTREILKTRKFLILPTNTNPTYC